MLDLRDGYRLGQGFRQRPHERLHRRKAGRLIADELTVARDRGLQGRLRAERGRLGARKARLRLRHVGARHFADGEAVPRLAQLFFQHVDVVAVEAENGRILQHVHIGGEGRKKGVLLGVAQLLARAEHLRLGLTDDIERPVAVEDGLVGGDAVAPRFDERPLRCRRRRHWARSHSFGRVRSRYCPSPRRSADTRRSPSGCFRPPPEPRRAAC